MRTRKQDYLDMTTHTGKYGIDVWNPDTHCWNGVAENGKPLLYDTAAERDAKRKEISKMKSVKQQWDWESGDLTSEPK